MNRRSFIKLGFAAVFSMYVPLSVSWRKEDYVPTDLLTLNNQYASMSRMSAVLKEYYGPIMHNFAYGDNPLLKLIPK